MTSSALRILPTPTGTPKAFLKAYVNSRQGSSWNKYSDFEYKESEIEPYRMLYWSRKRDRIIGYGNQVAWPAAKAAKEAKEAANQIKAKEAVKKDKRWNGLETEPFAEIWV